MKTLEEILTLFPLKGIITKDIIKNSVVHDIYTCRGANTLRQALGDNAPEKVNSICWGINSGYISEDVSEGRKELFITTTNNVDMMNEDLAPQEVTFTAKLEITRPATLAGITFN